MNRRRIIVLSLVLGALAGCVRPSFAHGIVGKRLFIEPLVTEDANPKNELDLPVLQIMRTPDGRFVSFNYSIEKLVRPGISVDFENSYNWFTPVGGPRLSGLGNVGFGLKYALYRSVDHEFIMSAKLGVEAPTGESAAGADPFTTLSPEFLYAAGMGGLPNDNFLRWLRPFAVQGDFGVDVPVGGAHTPDRANVPFTDLVLEYSIPYLDTYVRQSNSGYSVGGGGFRKGASLGAIAGDLFPFLSLSFQASPYRGGRRALGYYRPGVVYVGHYFELGGAAEFPANSFTGKNVGAIFILDFFIGEIFPGIHRLQW